MKTQEELRADFQRFMDADMLDEAEAVLEQLEPLSDEDVQHMLASAPIDDEPVTTSERTGFEEIKRHLAGRTRQRAG